MYQYLAKMSKPLISLVCVVYFVHLVYPSTQSTTASAVAECSLLRSHPPERNKRYQRLACGAPFG